MKAEKGEPTTCAESGVVVEDGQQLTLLVVAIGQLFAALTTVGASLLIFVAEKENPGDMVLIKDSWDSSLHMSPLIVSWKNCTRIDALKNMILVSMRGWV